MSNIGKVTVTVDNRKLFEQRFEAAILKSLEECGLVAENYAKKQITKNKSVVTGNLRNSITHEVDAQKKQVFMGTNVEYAPYVELGTSRAREKPYLRPALNDHTRSYTQVFKKNLQNG